MSEGPHLEFAFQRAERSFRLGELHGGGPQVAGQMLALPVGVKQIGPVTLDDGPSFLAVPFPFHALAGGGVATVPQQAPHEPVNTRVATLGLPEGRRLDLEIRARQITEDDVEGGPEEIAPLGRQSFSNAALCATRRSRQRYSDRCARRGNRIPGAHPSPATGTTFNGQTVRCADPAGG